MTEPARLQTATYAAVALLGLVAGLTAAGLAGSRVLAVVAQMVGLLGTAALTALVARARRHHHPERARAWLLTAFGLATFGITGTPRLFALIEAGPFTFVELTGFPFVIAGLILLRRTLVAPARARRLAALDGTLVGAAVAVLVWTLIFGPFVNQRTLAEVLAVGLFPLATMLLMSYWVLPLLLLDRHNPMARWFVAINGGILAVDLTVALLRLSGMTEQDQLRGFYGLVIVMVALATADPRSWTVAELSPSEAFLDRERIVLISVSLAVIPSVLLGSAVLGTQPNLPVLGSGTAVMVSIVAIRLRGALRDADRLQSRLRHLAEVDALTGLANRRAAEEQLEIIEDRGGEAAVMFIDLDGFKAVNDRRGHQIGDQLLREVADRLRACTRDGDVVARFGGDEFVVLSPGLPAEQAQMVARRIQRAVTGRYELDGQAEEVGASVGVAVDELDTNGGAAAILQAADDAMYAAKAAGKGQVIMAAAGH